MRDQIEIGFLHDESLSYIKTRENVITWALMKRMQAKEGRAGHTNEVADEDQYNDWNPDWDDAWSGGWPDEGGVDYMSKRAMARGKGRWGGYE